MASGPSACRPCSCRCLPRQTDRPRPAPSLRQSRLQRSGGHAARFVRAPTCRSWSNLARAFSSEGSGAASSRDAIGGLDDVGKRAMRALRFKLDRPGRADIGRGDFGGPVLKAVRHHDLNAMCSARYRVLDRLDLGLQHTLGDDTRDAPVLVERKLEGRKHRIMNLGYDHAEDMEQRALGRMLARHDFEQRLALFRGSALVDNRLHLPIALMQRPGEMHGSGEHQTIKLGALEMSFGNPHADHALARAMGRRGIEIAGAAKRAIAILDPFAFEPPVGCSHSTPPAILLVGRWSRLINPFGLEMSGST